MSAGLELLRKASQAPEPAPLLAGALALLRDAIGPAAQARDLIQLAEEAPDPGPMIAGAVALLETSEAPALRVVDGKRREASA